MNIFDEVNSLPEALVTQRLGLATARDGKSFLCPDCGNGSGKLVWHCYRCGGHWSNVDLVALVEGIAPSNTAELAKKLEELFPESNKSFLFSRGEDFSHFSAADRQASKSASGDFGYRSDGDSLASSDSRRFEPVPPAGVLDRTSEPVPPKNYAKAFYPRYVETTRKFLAERGGSYRGLMAETFEKYGKIVPELEKRFGNAQRKPSFFVMFDNDTTGKTNGLKLVEELKKAGYPAELFFLSEHMAGENYPKVDANDLLQSNPNELVRRLLYGLEKSYESLAKQKTANEERRQAVTESKWQENKSGIEIFSFTDYFAGEFFRDIELTAKYSERKTGFENIDAAQVFMPGLYVLGALPASGKTTFAWQLLNQLAEKGEPCVYCSFEMSKAELFTKSIVRELYRKNPQMSERLNLTSANIRRRAMRGSSELQEQAAQFAKSAMNLRVVELSNTSVTELIEGLKPLMSEVDKSPVICIDYLQIIPSKSVKGVSAKEKIDEVMLRLKDYQRSTNTTLIIISAFNRENYWQPVSFSSFKESGAIEYSADVIWGLENHGVDAEGHLDKSEVIKMSKEKVRKVKFSCLKNRNGSVYECYFRYHAEYDYFEVCEENETSSRRIYEH